MIFPKMKSRKIDTVMENWKRHRAHLFGSTFIIQQTFQVSTYYSKPCEIFWGQQN